MVAYGWLVILQRTCRMKTVKTPKHCPFPWCYKNASAICIRVDAKRNFNELREEESGHEPYQPGESFTLSNIVTFLSY